MTPAQALERVAFALERAGAPTPKVAAFRRALAVVLATGEAEVARLAAAGRLTTLAGVGRSTAGVITQALAGGVPDYLADLEERVEPPPQEGRELREALRGDCHSHSTWSDGGSDLATMAVAARGLGHAYLVVTDHSPRLRVAHGLSPERLQAQGEQIATLNAALAAQAEAGDAPPFRLLRGIEVDILPDGSLDQESELLAQLDVVVGSVHSHLRSDAETMTRRMLTAIADPHLDVLGHCTGRRVVEPRRPPSAFDADAVFAACAEHDVAVEVNSRVDRLDPPRELLRRAVAAGCSFTIDTDAHAPGQLDWQWRGTQRAAQCGVSADRVLNTLDAQGLVDRLAGRR